MFLICLIPSLHLWSEKKATWWEFLPRKKAQTANNRAFIRRFIPSSLIQACSSDTFSPMRTSQLNKERKRPNLTRKVHVSANILKSKPGHQRRHENISYDFSKSGSPFHNGSAILSCHSLRAQASGWYWSCSVWHRGSGDCWSIAAAAAIQTNKQTKPSLDFINVYLYPLESFLKYICL